MTEEEETGAAEKKQSEEEVIKCVCPDEKELMAHHELKGGRFDEERDKYQMSELGNA